MMLLWLFSMMALVVSSLNIPDDTETDLSRDRRMVNGQKAKLKYWKFLGELKFPADHRWKTCSASLFSEKDRTLMITAAHCVYDLRNNPERMKVSLQTGEDEWTEVAVASIVVHGGYNWEMVDDNGVYHFDDDIALIKLSTPAPAYMEAMPLRDANVTPVNQCKSAGWGTIKKLDSVEEYENNLYEVSMVVNKIDAPRAPDEECQVEGNQNLICIGVISDKPKEQEKIGIACVGDSGSPVTCRDDNNKRWLHGVLITTVGLCDAGTGYMMATDVGKYHDWIRQNS